MITPASTEQVGAALSLCAEARAAVIPWGGGTAMALGNPPRRADVVVRTTGLQRSIEHDAANLTITVQAGMSLAVLQSTLAPERQFAALDPPLPVSATVGGTVAAIAVAYYLSLPIGLATLAGFLVSSLGVFGDLSISLLKREAGLKDSGKLFPGHGGALDRTDSLIWAVAIVYYLVLFLGP